MRVQNVEEDIIEAIIESAIAQFCVNYNTMVPALWKDKLGSPKNVFRANDDFVT